MNAVVIGYTAEVGEEVEEKCKSVNSKKFFCFLNVFFFLVDGYIVKPASEK